MAIERLSAAKDNDLIAIGMNFDFAQEVEMKQADIVVNNFINSDL